MRKPCAMRVSPDDLALYVACALVLSTGTALALPAFDSGTGVEFNAEDNALVSYAANPAKLIYCARSAVLLDVGGDFPVGNDWAVVADVDQHFVDSADKRAFLTIRVGAAYWFL